jgi:hypothetical protein
MQVESNPLVGPCHAGVPTAIQTSLDLLDQAFDRPSGDFELAIHMQLDVLWLPPPHSREVVSATVLVRSPRFDTDSSHSADEHQLDMIISKTSCGGRALPGGTPVQ